MGCKDFSLKPEIAVYNNDFESEDYTGIEGVFISIFESNRVMGFFNKRGFNLNLPSLPEHDFIRLTFDLYVHDSWEGNANLDGEALDEKDSWVLEIDTAKNLKGSDILYYETTFSNGLCIPGFCYTQSFPDQFPLTNDAKKGASLLTNGRCLWSNTPTGTSMYKMDLVFPHKDRTAVLTFYDKLNGNLCDESWSLDNLSVSTFKKE
ncbi:hypothetical protein BFP97_13505 [Roseivirga sp. 4D4]|nr:hypothetical protein BFP97_13505 [Roseivirga sp. 4D4]